MIQCRTVTEEGGGEYKLTATLDASFFDENSPFKKNIPLSGVFKTEYDTFGITLDEKEGTATLTVMLLVCA